MLTMRIEFYDIFLILTLATICINQSNGFNVSPVPNIVIRQPIEFDTSENSYFGFSINLKSKSVLIGAPRAQAKYLPLQTEINEPGAVYKCDLSNNSDEKCKPFVFDKLGNENERFQKDGQWLGMAMDGSEYDNETFVVCAPRFITECKECYYGTCDRKRPYACYNKAMHGLCYWTTDTSQSEPKNVQPVVTISKDQLIIDTDPNQNREGKYQQLRYLLGQQGFSVHTANDNNEILMGEPGSDRGRGTVIRKKVNVPPGRNVLNEIADQIRWSDSERREYDTYFGFSISSGYFEINQQTRLLYLAGAPKETNYDGTKSGAVHIFDIETYGLDTKMERYFTFYGEYLSEYFGYSVVAEDFDNDNLTDVAIGAPHRDVSGAVYIYKNQKTNGNRLDFQLHRVLKTGHDGFGMFGTTLSKIGDINRDGYNDLLVSAPFEGNGVVYIYLGSSDGLSDRPSQKIIAPHDTFASKQMFGHGLSKAVDIDGNHYGDFAVGAPNSATVYIYKTYPVIQIYASIEPTEYKIQTTDETFKLLICFRYGSIYNIPFDVNFEAIVKLTDKYERAYFKNEDEKKVKEHKIDIILTSKFAEQNESSPYCLLSESSVKFLPDYIYEPINIIMNYDVKNTIPEYDRQTSKAQEFCDKCVAVDPMSPKEVKTAVKFDTGCKSEHCITELIIKSSSKYDATTCNGERSLKLGSNSDVTIEYAIHNNGETAFSVYLYVTLPKDTKFRNTPSNCEEQLHVEDSNCIKCRLASNGPIFHDEDTANFSINIDTSQHTTLDPIRIVANVSSYNNEMGVPVNDSTAEVTIPLAAFSNIDIDGRSVTPDITILDDTDQNITHTFEITNNSPTKIDSLDVFVYLPTHFVDPATKNGNRIVDIGKISVQSNFNIRKSDTKWTEDMIHKSHVPENFLKTDNRVLGSLDPGETNFVQCRNTLEYKDKSDEYCYKEKFTITDLDAGASFYISLTFPIDMKEIIHITSGERSNLIISSSIFVQKSSDDLCFSVNIRQNPHTIFTRPMTKATPLWVYVVSCVFGTLILELISIAMYKSGFFRRAKHEELKQLKRASHAASAPSPQQEPQDTEEMEMNTTDL